MVMLSYRQEKFIAEAVRGALAQRSAAIDIVISDDASPDGTWDVIKREVANYRGPHRLILNRNEHNLGLMGNLMKAISLSSARYLVIAAGDDVSEPHRVTKMLAAFAGGGQRRSIAMVISDATRIDGSGASLHSPLWRKGIVFDAEEMFATGQIVGGAGAAYRREVFDAFPPPNPAIYNDDAIFCQRAIMLGQVVIVPEMLLRYRKHGQNISTTPPAPRTPQELAEQLLDQCAYWRVVIDQQRSDVVWAMEKGIVDPGIGARLLRHMDRHMRNNVNFRAALQETAIRRRILRVMALRGYPLRRRMRMLAIALSPRFYIRAADAWRQLRTSS